MKLRSYGKYIKIGYDGNTTIPWNRPITLESLWPYCSTDDNGKFCYLKYYCHGNRELVFWLERNNQLRPIWYDDIYQVENPNDIRIDIERALRGHNSEIR